MQSVSSSAVITHTSASGDVEALSREIDREVEALRKRLGRTFPNRIAGRDDLSGKPYLVVSPADHSVEIGSFVETSEDAVHRAVNAARVAQKTWSQRPWQERVAILRKVGQNFERNLNMIAAAVMIEVGKPRLDAVGEVGEAVGMFRQYCDQMERNNGYDGAVLHAGERETAQTVFRPFGVFAAITPFNFPVALPVNVICGALLAGNTIVFKPSPAAGLTGSLVTQMFEDSGLPPGSVNMICGYGAGALLADANVDGYAFIGSQKVGTELIRKAAAGSFPRPVISEMGGKNPTYVTRSADIAVAAQGVAKSAFGGAGQKCTCCSVAFVHSSIYEAFAQALVERAKDIRIGNTLEDGAISAGPLINEAAMKRYQANVEYARKKGRVLTGGARLTGGAHDRGFYAAPTVVDGLPADDPILKTELFCPFVVLVPFDDFEEALDRGNSVVFGLSSGFYGSDTRDREIFLRKVEAGILYLNRPHGATTGGWPGIQVLTGWKGSGSTGKGSMGEHFVPQFMRQQCRTIREA